jgi:hypothetical protein
MAPPAAAAPPNPSASDPASVAAALRDYERRLGEKEAHLKMLRSRLEIAERDGETARRRLEAGRLERERERERERNAAAGGFGHIQNDVRGSNPKPYSLDADTLNSTLNGTNGTNGRGFGSDAIRAIRAGGPAPMEVSNAAALQEARAELARLRARVAFKDEEAEEARRREDEQRASLRRSEAEAMRLAAEVRKERRRAAAAEGDSRRARDVNGEGGEKRSRDVFVYGAVFSTNEAEAEAEAARLRSEERVDGSDAAGERRFEPPETLPPAPPVSLVLPPPPASLASGFSSDRASVFPDGAAAFAATVAAAPTAARAILGFAGPARAARAPSGSRGSDTSSPDDGVALAAFRLRDVLSDLAADAATAASFAAAAADLVVAAAEELKQSRSDEQSADADAFDARVGVSKRRASSIFPSRASFLRDVARDAMFAAAAAARADASAAATLARLFGVADAAPTYGYLVAPRPPPEPLAGVPAAGTDHVGMLAPHPGARGGFELETRVFAPASALRGSSPEGPEGPSANVFPATVGEVRNGRGPSDFSIGDDRAFGTHTLGTLRGTHTRGARELTPSLPSSFLSSVLVILSSSLSAGDWFAARAALRLLSRAAAEADPLRARGVFAVTAAAGLLERALGGEGARRGPDGARAAASAAARSADAADAASAPTGGARDADRPSGPDRERDTRALFASSRSSHAEWNASRPRPPARVRRDALALVRLLAATPEFAASLSGAAAPRLAAERDALPRKTSRAGGDAAAKRKNQKERDAVSDDVGEALEDGEEPGEEPPDYPLLRAVVACVEEFAEEASFIGDASSLETSPLETFAVEDELEGVGAYHRVGSGTAADAALLTLAAISHAGWSGWGDAVRRHGVLAAAVVAAEAAFAMAGASAAAAAADQRRLRHALMFVARLLAEPASARAASSALRRDGETCRRLARVARAANAHAEQMPRRVGKYLDSVLTAWS